MISAPALTIQLSETAENSVEASWAVSSGADEYVLQKSRTPDFIPGDTVTVYTGVQTLYTDTYKYSGIYYYRVKAVSETEESEWSVEQEIAVRVQIVADFQVSLRGGTVPLEVSFTDRSAGDVTEWLWNFGDGEFSTLRNPIHVYSNVGVYKVTLTAGNSEGSDTEVKQDLISAIDIYTHDRAPEPDSKVFLAGKNTVSKKDAGVKIDQESRTAGGFVRSSGPSLIFD